MTKTIIKNVDPLVTLNLLKEELDINLEKMFEARDLADSQGKDFDHNDYAFSIVINGKQFVVNNNADVFSELEGFVSKLIAVESL